jgi:hypothetical protein
MLYWNIGDQVRKEILNERRAGYGQEIVSTVSRQLVEDYGNSFTDKNLRRMIHFGEAFHNEKIVAAAAAMIELALILPC